MGATGLEPDSVSDDSDKDLQKSPVDRGSESGAVSGDFASIDPAFAELANAWPTLPLKDRAAILGIVRASKVELE